MINQIDMARAINFCLNRRLDAGGEQLTATQALEVVRDEGTAGAAGAAHVRDRIFPTVGRCIRGSQHYWDAARRRLVSMVATLGSPTLFFTATFDDRNCVAMYNAVDSERFPDAASVAALTSQERTAFVNANTAFITRFIYHRWQTLLAFLESDATPLGHAVRDFFWRCEEQGRGTLHFHSVLWLDTLTGDADDVDRQRRLLQWTMDYITTATPNDDSVLAALVREFQYHSRRHTASCEKGNDKRKKRGVTGLGIRQSKHVQSRAAGRARADAASEEDDDQSDEEAPPPWAHENDAEAARLRRRFFAEHRERDRCRYGYPHPLCDDTHLRTEEESRFLCRGDRDIILRRATEQARYTNGYNPGVLRFWEGNIDIQPVFDPYACVAYMLSYVTKSERDEASFLQAVVDRAGDNANARSLLYQFGNALLSNRQIGQQLATAIVLGFPLYGASRRSIFCPAQFPHHRRRTLLPELVLRNMLPGDTEVFGDNIVDRYHSRPAEMRDLSLYTFCAWYEDETRSGPRQHVADNPEEQDADTVPERRVPGAQGVNPTGHVVRPNPDFLANETFTVPPFITVHEATDRIALRQPRFESHGNHVLRQRQRPRVVSVPSFSSLGECELLYAQLLLHVPHRDERLDLLGDADADFTDADVIAAWERHTGGGDLARHAPPAVRARSARVGQSVFDNFQLFMGAGRDGARTVPGTGWTPQSSSFGRGRRAGPQPAPSSSSSSSASSSSSPSATNPSRGQGQLLTLQVVAAYMRECRAQRRPGGTPPAPPRLFITGGAGAGKSYVIDRIRDMFHADNARNTVRPAHGGIAVTATTGVAANNIGGSTYHRSLGLRPMRKGQVNGARCSAERLQSLRRNWSGIRCVVIDECSMCSGESLTQISQRLNLIMGVQGDPEATFGNLVVILVGDFYQLRPVMARFMFQDAGSSDGSVNLYRTLFHPIVLEGSFRQDDAPFLALLNRVRVGNANAHDLSLLATRQAADNLDEYFRNFTEAPHLFPTRALCDSHNHQWFARLGTRSGQPMYLVRATNTTASTLFVEPNTAPDPARHDSAVSVRMGANSDETGSLEPWCPLMIGGRVMLRSNQDTSDGLVNGAMGTLVGIVWRGADGQLTSTPPHPIPGWTEEGDGARLQAHLQRVADSAGLEEVTAEAAGLPAEVYVAFDDGAGLSPANSVVVRVPRPRQAGVVEVQYDNVRVTRIRPTTRVFQEPGSVADASAGNRRPLLSRTQLSLTACWAMTYHKCQGLTLPRAVCHISKDNPGSLAGMAYVGLSRVPRLDCLMLSHFDPTAIRASDDVRREYARLGTLLQAGAPGNENGSGPPRFRSDADGEVDPAPATGRVGPRRAPFGPARPPTPQPPAPSSTRPSFAGGQQTPIPGETTPSFSLAAVAAFTAALAASLSAGGAGGGQAAGAAAPGPASGAAAARRREQAETARAAAAARRREARAAAVAGARRLAAEVAEAARLANQLAAVDTAAAAAARRLRFQHQVGHTRDACEVARSLAIGQNRFLRQALQSQPVDLTHGAVNEVGGIHTPCPGCGEVLEKQNLRRPMCDGMICSKCGVHFCFFCFYRAPQEDYATRNHGSHYTSNYPGPYPVGARNGWCKRRFDASLRQQQGQHEDREECKESL